MSATRARRLAEPPARTRRARAKEKVIRFPTVPPWIVSVVLLANSDWEITDAVEFQGRPFTLGRENTRIYILRNDVPAVIYQVESLVRPRYLDV